MSLNSIYRNKNKVDKEFWRELGVSVDSIMESHQEVVTNRVKQILEKETVSGLKDLANLYDIEVNGENKDNIVINLQRITIEEQKQLLLLRDFQNRRKQSIDIYYQKFTHDKEEKYNSSSLTKLKHMVNDSYVTLIEIYTLHSWSTKSTGVRYTYEKGITEDKAIKIPTEYKNALIDHMYVNTGKEKSFKIFSYLKIRSEILFILYKQVNDAPRADFDKAVRNKEVAPIMASIDAGEKVIEIKGGNQADKNALISYFKDNFNGCHPTPVKLEVFEKYTPEKVSNAFITGVHEKEKKVDDFTVNKIEFRESPIQNSPKVVLELEDQDIWPSVKYAYNKDCVNLESLKGVKSLGIKSENKSRIVRSIILDNGNVLFTLDDSNLSSSTKRNICEKFLQNFGIPLNQEIVNSKFSEGKADKVDYIMGNNSLETLSEDGKGIFKDLINERFIDETQKQLFKCNNCNLEQEYDDDIPEECPGCGNTSLGKRTTSEQNLNIKNIKKFIKEKLSSLEEYDLSSYKPSTTIDNTKYSFFKLDHIATNGQNQVIQCLVTEESVPLKHQRRIKTMMTPTIIIFVGYLEKYIESYNNDCIHPTTFGNIYTRDEREFSLFFNKMVELLEKRQRSFVHNAASIAESSLMDVDCKPSSIPKQYNDKKFEDDVYAIIKEIFPNSEKWGKEKSGVAVPEGVFASAHKIQRGAQEKRKVFSYDCKFTRQDSGYDLSIEEKRKAVEYVNTLNGNEIIQSFSDTKELSSHIFISNKFNESQFNSIKEHFYTHIDDGSNARVVFLDLQVLLLIYSMYRKNYQHVLNAHNIFSQEIVKLLNKENIKPDDVNKLYRKVLNKNVGEYSQLDTDSVNEFLDFE